MKLFPFPVLHPVLYSVQEKCPLPWWNGLPKMSETSNSYPQKSKDISLA